MNKSEYESLFKVHCNLDYEALFKIKNRTLPWVGKNYHNFLIVGESHYFKQEQQLVEMLNFNITKECIIERIGINKESYWSAAYQSNLQRIFLINDGHYNNRKNTVPYNIKKDRISENTFLKIKSFWESISYFNLIQKIAIKYEERNGTETVENKDFESSIEIFWDNIKALKPKYILITSLKSFGFISNKEIEKNGFNVTSTNINTNYRVIKIFMLEEPDYTIDLIFVNHVSRPYKNSITKDFLIKEYADLYYKYSF